MSEASRNWPDYGRVIEDNLQAQEDERQAGNEPGDSDEVRVERARQAHEAMAAEPVSVADQKAAGVPDEETVTIADQKAGTPAPDVAGPAE